MKTWLSDRLIVATPIHPAVFVDMLKAIAEGG